MMWLWLTISATAARKSLERVEEITSKQIKFYEVDLLDKPALDKIFSAEKIEAVVHFAALKSSGKINPDTFTLL